MLLYAAFAFLVSVEKFEWQIFVCIFMINLDNLKVVIYFICKNYMDCIVESIAI